MIFEPGYICRVLSWAVELTRVRAAESGKLQPLHFTWLPSRIISVKHSPAVCMSWSSSAKPFTKSCVKGLQ